MSLNLRTSARAIILDENDHVLLCRFGFPRWWQLSEITNYTGPDLFSPRDLATPLTDLLTSGIPAAPVTFGL